MNKRTLFGTFVLLFGAFMLIGALDIYDTGELLSTYWPVLLIIIGAYKLVDGSNNYGMAVLLIFFGAVFLGKSLGIDFLAEVNVWSLIWPVIIIMFGIYVLFGRKMDRSNVSENEMLDVVAFFSGAQVLNESSEFKGGNITTIFGGAEVDLRNAIVPYGETAYIEAFSAFGGIDIKVPKDWKVQVKMVPIFGGWGNKTAYSKDNTQPVKLVVKGFIAFGGVDIKN